MKKIFVITSSNDRTVDYLVGKYSDISFFRLDVDLFYEFEISILIDSISIKSKNDHYDFKHSDSIYYRKPSLPDLSPFLSNEYHEFAYREIFSVIDGIIESHTGKCITKPSILRRANNKIYQIEIARKCGLSLPYMAITNSISTVQNVCATKSIVKPIAYGEVIHSDEKEFVQTNLFDHSIPLDQLKCCPAYFQHFVAKDFDVRIVFVGRKAYSFAIHSTNHIDWRKPEAKNKYSVVELPNDIYSKCCQMLDEVDMQFGCFDFVVKDDEYYFLELNANGQWGWLEFETGICISDELIKELMK
ncbi:hypothetical protein [Desulfovibrio sp. JC010]|uniref:hypothetical protein n=1 Tax=Desulfovibrio sp. JC010 TaxID=2593641 RepID=UPI0013D57A27|nr:hypothetical protein [Desulfovibrio sp. JC010]NDV28584.1 hypothetical protein [Desulfovibrio sp. JC010]